MKEIRGLWKRQKCDLNTVFFLGEFVSSFDIPVLICHKAHIKWEFNDEILCHWSSGGSAAWQWTVTEYAQRNLLWQHHFASLYHLRKQRVNWNWKSRVVFRSLCIYSLMPFCVLEQAIHSFTAVYHFLDSKSRIKWCNPIVRLLEKRKCHWSYMALYWIIQQCKNRMCETFNSGWNCKLSETKPWWDTAP